MFLLESAPIHLFISIIFINTLLCQSAKLLTISNLVVFIPYQQSVDNFDISEMRSTDNFVAYSPSPCFFFLFLLNVINSAMELQLSSLVLFLNLIPASPLKSLICLAKENRFWFLQYREYIPFLQHPPLQVDKR